MLLQIIFASYFQALKVYGAYHFVILRIWSHPVFVAKEYPRMLSHSYLEMEFCWRVRIIIANRILHVQTSRCSRGTNLSIFWVININKLSNWNSEIKASKPDLSCRSPKFLGGFNSIHIGIIPGWKTYQQNWLWMDFSTCHDHGPSSHQRIAIRANFVCFLPFAGPENHDPVTDSDCWGSTGSVKGARLGEISRNFKVKFFITHDGSMVLLYMVLHGSHQYTPFLLAYIPAPWIRHG